MGKKVDLNARRNNNNFRKSTHNINYYNNNNSTSLSQENANSEENENTSAIGKNNSYYRREYDIPKSVNLTIKMPTSTKAVITAAIIGIPLLLLMFFTVLFAEDYTLYYSRYKFGQTCARVTVIDTENYRYDGEVSFEDYIAGVVAAESQGSHDLEYLKLLSILARTYFFENASSNCTVKGNSEFQQYEDIDDVNNRHAIKKAMQETEDLIITDSNNLNSINYNAGCVLKDDGSNYHIRYGKSTGKVKFQQIPKSWAEDIGINEELERLYLITEETIKEMKNEFDRIEQEKKVENPKYEIKKFIVDYDTLPCPENTSDDGISKIGALHLIDAKYYEYEKVIKYYTEKNLEIIKNEITHEGTTTSNGEFINPTSTIYCSSPYSERIDPNQGIKKFHKGIDIAASAGTPIYATKSGKITKVVKNVKINNANSATSSNGYGYGNQVMIDHGDGITTFYAHMKYGSIPDSIYEGAQVSQGEKIGEIGSTGKSTGNHLHYEVKENGTTVDPADYLDLTNAKGTCEE